MQKISLYDTKIGSVLGQEHDYNPTAEHDLAPLPRGEKMEDLRIALEIASEELLGDMGFPGAVVFLSKKGQMLSGALGMYVDGTSQYPYIGMDLASIYGVCRKTGDVALDQLKGTIAHELGHAWLDSRCIREEDLDEDSEEIAVEKFAYEWVMYGDVRLDILAEILPDSVKDSKIRHL